MKIQVLVFMSEIEFDLTVKKSKLSVSFMLLFIIIKLLLTLRLSRQKTNFFPQPFRVNLVLVSVLRGMILVKNVVLTYKLRLNSI